MSSINESISSPSGSQIHRTISSSTHGTSTSTSQPYALLNSNSLQYSQSVGNSSIQTPVQTPTTPASRLWHETQQKLAEVEAAAANSGVSGGVAEGIGGILSPSTSLPGAYIFGPAHTEAIEALRAAQNHLAQAWMRSEDDAEREELDAEHEGLRGGGAGPSGVAEKDEKGKAPATPGTGGEEDWEGGVDLRLARKRRDANERHFRKVRELVLDVGGRLDAVAEAMMKVENESRGVWEEAGGESLETRSGRS